ncbi:MAG TPA: rhodanese-like domain-containing protein [Chitinophagaceae bacterium]|nr:rhodanese-like domain-containing protein [Chitinophagaceae bacterium]HAN37756.1 rhodanese-like domain-containing protein [Chitinophagaceae bacterium]
MLSFFKKLMGESTDFKALMEAGAVVVDVRTPGEYAGGHIAGSKNYPLDSLQQHISTIKKWNKPVITVCRSGARSGMAIGVLKAAGIEAVNGGSWDGLQQKLG